MKCVGRFSSIFSLINIFTLSITIVEKIVMSQLSAYAEMLIEILYHQKRRILTLLTVGTSSCNALIRSAILSLRSCNVYLCLDQISSTKIGSDQTFYPLSDAVWISGLTSPSPNSRSDRRLLVRHWWSWLCHWLPMENLSTTHKRIKTNNI